MIDFLGWSALAVAWVLAAIGWRDGDPGAFAAAVMFSAAALVVWMVAA